MSEGARAGSLVLHPEHVDDEVLPRGAGRVVDPLVRVPVVEPGEPVRVPVHLDTLEVEVPIPEVRRGSRVRQEKRDKDYLYY